MAGGRCYPLSGPLPSSGLSYPGRVQGRGIKASGWVGASAPKDIAGWLVV
ncbi:MAG: hypothetical protein NTY03_05820 [Candidatus Bathyarchaeota archaeon]|nr:hypothetical protein [Candidatus Bathyarchaeota archaeon]